MILKQHTQRSPKGLSSRWIYFQRTATDIEWIIWTTGKRLRDQLIPALVGQEVCDAERQKLAFPLRHGELGLTDPQETVKTEFERSTQITDKQLIYILKKLDLDCNPLDQHYARHMKNRIRQGKNTKSMPKHPWSMMNFWGTDPWITTTHKRSNGKQASSWLSALQIKVIGYALTNKNSQMPSAWDTDGRWKTYPFTVLMEGQSLWNTASCVNWVATLQWGATQWETEAQIMREVMMIKS